MNDTDQCKALIDAMTDVLVDADDDMALNALSRVSAAFIASHDKDAGRVLKRFHRDIRKDVADCKEFLSTGTVDMRA